jgi:soluble lytic murein transglycosylase-like protein
VLLPRRTSTWPAHQKCRSKGKAVIVRIGKLNPGVFQGLQPGWRAQWSRRLVSVVVLCASVAALALIIKDQYDAHLLAASQQPVEGLSQAGAAPAAGREAAVLSPAEESRYRALSGFVANRYRVSNDVAYDLVRVAHREAHLLQLDPLLIIAVIAIESRFNPIAESVAGAKGLMQIIPKYHTDKLQEFGGVDAVYDPAANIQVGARILKEYLRLTGNMGSALQMYAGALSDTEDQYTHKVLNEKNRLQQVLAQNRTSAPAPVRTASAAARIPASPLSLD